jgi:hypothetical protein
MLVTGEEEGIEEPGERVWRPCPAELAVVPWQAQRPRRQQVALGAARLVQPHPLHTHKVDRATSHTTSSYPSSSARVNFDQLKAMGMK